MKLAGLLFVATMMFGCATGSAAKAASVASSFHGTALAKGSIDIIGPIDASTLGPAQAKFDELVKSGEKTVLFRIDSPGGEVFPGLDFIHHVQDAKAANGLTVQCVARGKAMSMAFVIFESCDERYVVPGTMFLAHGAAVGAQGKDDDLKGTLSLMEAMNEAMAEIVTAHMSITYEEYLAKTAHSDWFFASREAFVVGAADATLQMKDVPPSYVLAAPETEDIIKKLLGG